MPTPMIVANWKMNKGIGETRDFFNVFLPLIKEVKLGRVVIAPSFISLYEAVKLVNGTIVQIGAQNMSELEIGAFTGEVCGELIVSAGADFVILGHSERRALFGEQNAGIAAKVKRALELRLTPILCIGETLPDRESGREKEVLKAQLYGGLDGLSEEEIEKVVIAYEPVWAIGTGRTATAQMANETHAFIRGVLNGLVENGISAKMHILYGGSVKPENMRELMAEEDVNGVLVGGASLDPYSFAKIVNNGLQ